MLTTTINEPRAPKGSEMNLGDAIEVWPRVGEFRCLLGPCADFWELALMRQHLVVKVEWFAEPAAALAAADDWRRPFDQSYDDRSVALPSNEERRR